MNSRFTATVAKRQKLKARIGLTGATNAGKTYTALLIAEGLLISEGCLLEDGTPDWSKVVVIDTERERSKFYAGIDSIGNFTHIDFKPPFDPLSYIDAVAYAESLGATVCIIDSISHAWMGTGGVLEIVHERTEKSRSKNTFTEGWGGKEGGTALQNKMIDNIMASKMHTICTFRQKMEYTQEKDEVTGRTVIVKQGVKPVQKDDLEYEFDITLKLNNDHTAEVIKNTVKFLEADVDKLPVITSEFGKVLGDYLNKGEDPNVSKQKIKEDYINKIKTMGEKYPPLFEYFKAKYPDKPLNNLSLNELSELIKTFKEMI